MGVMMICCSSWRAFRRFPPSKISCHEKTTWVSHAVTAIQRQNAFCIYISSVKMARYIPIFTQYSTIHIISSKLHKRNYNYPLADVCLCIQGVWLQLTFLSEQAHNRCHEHGTSSAHADLDHQNLIKDKMDIWSKFEEIPLRYCVHTCMNG